MRAFGAVLVLILLVGCQPPPSGEMTDAQKADLIASAAQAAAEMIAAFDAEDMTTYLSFYSDWTDYPATSYPIRSEMPDRIMSSWFERYEDRHTEMGEVNGVVVGPDAVALERIDVSTATNAEGTRLEQRWVGRQLWTRASGEWKILFDGFQMLSTQEIQ